MKIRIYKNRLIWLSKSGGFHREDGPAIVWDNGTKHWYINDKRHREDGPAVEWGDGLRAWYVNGEYLTKDGFNRRKSEDSED